MFKRFRKETAEEKFVRQLIKDTANEAITWNYDGGYTDGTGYISIGYTTRLNRSTLLFSSAANNIGYGYFLYIDGCLVCDKKHTLSPLKLIIEQSQDRKKQESRENLINKCLANDSTDP